MNVAILGAGNVAWHISKAFIKAGHPVKQIWSRTPEKAVNIALEIGANSIADLSLLGDNIDLVVLAVSDDAIENVAAQLHLNSQQVLVHTSGSVSITVLEGYAVKYGVIYPLQTFSKDVQTEFIKVPVCVEGSTEEIGELLFSLAKDLSENAQLVNSEQRMLLHISAVFASNFTNHFYSIAQQILSDSGLSFAMIRPLIEATASKALHGSPIDLQTGPARRNDQLTMQKHSMLLNDKPEWRALYEMVSQNIVKMYDQNQA
jgi:predicted short-subunit dehydrogenase-like oxidoreductase (DUF2520 family)